MIKTAAFYAAVFDFGVDGLDGGATLRVSTKDTFQPPRRNLRGSFLFGGLPAGHHLSPPVLDRSKICDTLGKRYSTILGL